MVTPHRAVCWSAPHEWTSWTFGARHKLLRPSLVLDVCIYYKCSLFLSPVHIKTQVRQLRSVVRELTYCMRISVSGGQQLSRVKIWLTMSGWGTRLCTLRTSVIRFFTSVADTCLCAAWLSVCLRAQSELLFMYILLWCLHKSVWVGLYVKELKFRCLTTCTVCETSEPNPSHLLHKGMPS